MARTMALCSLPRTNPGIAFNTSDRTAPSRSTWSPAAETSSPMATCRAFLLAWVCTEAVRTQSRVVVLGKSLSEFMRALGMEPVGGGATGARTRLRNQMTRLFNATVSLIYKAKKEIESDHYSFVVDPEAAGGG